MRKSIILDTKQEKIISTQIKKGRFSTSEEVVNAGLQLLEDREQKIQTLRAAIIKGKESGYLDNFDPEQYLADINAKYPE